MLRSLRGGFIKGTRNSAVLLYAWLLSRSSMDREATLRQVERLGRECRPSLDQSACRAAVKTAFARKIKRVTDQIMADRLDVTPEGAEYLERLEPATRFRAKPVALIAPPMPVAQRRSQIEGYLRKHGSVPSCREMAPILAGRSCGVSHVQISRDYRALKLEPKVGWAIAVQEVFQLSSWKP